MHGLRSASNQRAEMSSISYQPQTLLAEQREISGSARFDTESTSCANNTTLEAIALPLHVVLYFDHVRATVKAVPPKAWTKPRRGFSSAGSRVGWVAEGGRRSHCRPPSHTGEIKTGPLEQLHTSEYVDSACGVMPKNHDAGSDRLVARVIRKTQIAFQDTTERRAKLFSSPGGTRHALITKEKWLAVRHRLPLLRPAKIGDIQPFVQALARLGSHVAVKHAVGAMRTSTMESLVVPVPAPVRAF